MMNDVSFAAVRKAEVRIRPYVRETPVFSASIPSPAGLCDIELKLEQLQISGTFKARGMFNSVIRAKEDGRATAAGFVIASGGNAGVAAAIAGEALGLPVTVVVPEGSPKVKLNRIRNQGAEVRIAGHTHPESQSAARDISDDSGAMLLHPYDLPDVVTGAGTIATEALHQSPRANAVIVAVGGGGLVAGVCVVARELGMKVVAVEPTGAPTLHDALVAGRPVDVSIDTIAKDSLGAVRIGEIAFSECRETGVESLLVTDAQIIAAQRYLWDEFRLLVEHSAAASVGALMSGAYVPQPGERPLIVLCGANVAVPLV